MFSAEYTWAVTHQFLECGGKFAFIDITEFFCYRIDASVCMDQLLRRFLHLLQTDKGCHRQTVNSMKRLLQIGSRNPELIGQLFQVQRVIQIVGYVCRNFFHQFGLCAGNGIFFISQLGRIYLTQNKQQFQ